MISSPEWSTLLLEITKIQDDCSILEKPSFSESFYLGLQVTKVLKVA